jgi:hypothetical protein
MSRLLKITSRLTSYSIILLVIAAFFTSQSLEGKESFEITTVEAAFIYQFTNYVQWPSRKPSSVGGTQPFVISIVGNSSVIAELQHVAATKTVKGRKIEIQMNPDAEGLKRSEIIVFTLDKVSALEDLANKTQGTGILIVSQGEGFAKHGAAINFFSENGRVRFEINRAAAEKRGLQISSQLLKLARVLD